MMKSKVSDFDLFAVEKELHASGYSRVAGIDEAGRGPLAGPVVAAAVILPAGIIPEVFDSKQLSPKRRDELYDELLSLDGFEYAVGVIEAEEIDRINILQATHAAMRLAVAGLMQPPDFTVVDGNPVKSLPEPKRNIVKGDAKCACIAAASIIAKVTRDRMMMKYDLQYPGYGFAGHKGYGTGEHIAALRKLGPCPIHRRSFAPVREIVSPDEQMTLF